MPIAVSELPVKFVRPKAIHKAGLTIYEVPGHGLYQVLEVNRDEFSVETLVDTGWIRLITFDETEASARAEALQRWLDILTPTPKPDVGQA
jgi:hypothetical protein